MDIKLEDLEGLNHGLIPILQKFFAQFPTTQVSPLTLLGYLEDLSEFSIELVNDGCLRVRRSHKLASLPPVGIIREEISRIKQERQEAIRKAQAESEMSAKEKDLAYQQEIERGEAIPCPWGADFLREMQKTFDRLSMPDSRSKASLESVVPSKGAPLPPELLAKYTPRTDPHAIEEDKDNDYWQ